MWALPLLLVLAMCARATHAAHGPYRIHRHVYAHPLTFVRTPQELEECRAAHADVPLTGLLFDDRDVDSIQFVHAAEPETPHEVLVAVHANVSAEFAGVKLPHRVRLNGVQRRRLHRAGSWGTLRRARLDLRKFARVAVLVYAPTKDSARAYSEWAHIADDIEKTHHIAVDARSDHPAESGFVAGLPLGDGTRHFIAVLEHGALTCGRFAETAADLRRQYETCPPMAATAN